MAQLLFAIIYLSFISLGLPDSLLGAAWPSIYEGFGVSISYAGAISMIISGGTIFSSLQSERLTRLLGTGRVTAASVAVTALALFGFSVSNSFWMLCLWAIPYGLGAGCVDASLNSYVALHYESRHMSWLHCMWGVGASLGPAIMGYCLGAGKGWGTGYRLVSMLQIGLTLCLVLSLPLWKRQIVDRGAEKRNRPLRLSQIVAIPGAREVMVTFFCYCALEQTMGLWAGSYLVLYKGLPAQQAASLVGLFYVGITVGRGICGFLTLRLSDAQMIRLGQGVIAVGILALLLPGRAAASLVGLVLIGLGCAPIYPCIIHSTPANFGAERAQAMMGVQMASAHVGSCVMPPIFGLIASRISVSMLSAFLLMLLVVMVIKHERMLKKAQDAAEEH